MNLAKTPPHSLLLFVFPQSLVHCKKSILLSYTFYLLGTFVSRSRIHERTTSLGFLDIILRVLMLDVSVHNVYIANQFQTTFFFGGGGVKNPLVEVTE